MDNLKIHDSELADGGKSSGVHAHLDSKLANATVSTEASFKSTSSTPHKSRKLMPKFAFRFGKHVIGEAVEYEV